VTTLGEKGIVRERRTDRPNERSGPSGSFVPDNNIEEALANRANEHRCVAPKPATSGARWACECGTVYEWKNSFSGWIPSYDAPEPRPHSHKYRAGMGSESDTDGEASVSLDDLFDGFDDAETVEL
jgi:hypothetical protein